MPGPCIKPASRSVGARSRRRAPATSKTISSIGSADPADAPDRSTPFRMISFAEFEIAFRGLLRLARFDGAFAGFFDLSQDGARRSFRLALPLLPVNLFLINLNVPWPQGSEVMRIGTA